MVLHPFDMLFELPDEAIRLDCAMLHLARDVYPDLNLIACVERLDALASEIRDERAGLSAVQRYEAMREVLVERHEFRGNENDYYDPQNAYLNRILDRKLGIPIGLSVVWIEVGRRLNWPVFGVGFPSHFLVRFDDPDRFLVADTFHEGRAVSQEECQKLLDHQFAGKVKFSAEMLSPVDNRAILARVLNNLRVIYRANQDWSRLDEVLQRLSVLDPLNEDHRMELAKLRSRLGNNRSAYAQLASFLNYRPEADDGDMVVQKLHNLAAMIASLN